MRPLAWTGLLISLILAGLAVFSTAKVVRTRRDVQDRALQSAVSDVVGRVSGTERQMTTAASQMLVNPAVLALLEPSRLSPTARRSDVEDAGLALATFEHEALVPVSSVCLDDAAATQVACVFARGGAVFPATLRRSFAALAAPTSPGLVTPSFPSPTTGRPTGALVMGLRWGGRLLGLVHFDVEMASSGRRASSRSTSPGCRWHWRWRGATCPWVRRPGGPRGGPSRPRRRASAPGRRLLRLPPLRSSRAGLRSRTAIARSSPSCLCAWASRVARWPWWRPPRR